MLTAEFFVGIFIGALTIGLAWAIYETIRRAKKPYRHVIYRKGQPPEVILR